MKFTVDTLEFKSAFERAFKVTGVKTIPSLENVRIKKIENDCHLLASNCEQYVDIVVFSQSKDSVEFSFSDSKAILKAMKFFTGEFIELDCDENEVTISCGGKKAKQRIICDDFPEFPIVGDTVHNSFVYTNTRLKKRLKSVKYAVSTEEHRKILMGVCFNGNDLVAVDGYRLAINSDADLAVTTPFVVPPAALKTVTEIMGKNITITTDSKHMFISDGQAAFITRLFDGEYFNYSTAINQAKTGYRQSCFVESTEFENSLKYLRTFNKAKGSMIVHWYADKLGVKNSSGYFESNVDIMGEMDIEIAFNLDYMLEALGQFSGRVKILLSSATAPILITDEDGDNNVALVLPIRAKETMFVKSVA